MSLMLGSSALAARSADARNAPADVRVSAPLDAESELRGLGTTGYVLGALLAVAVLIYIVSQVLDNDTNAVPLSP